MQKINKLLHRSYASLIGGVLIGSSLMGCKSGAFMRPFDEQNLRDRHFSVSQTPLAKAKDAERSGSTGRDSALSSDVQQAAYADYPDSGMVIPAQYAQRASSRDAGVSSVPRIPLTPAFQSPPNNMSLPGNGSPYHPANYTYPQAPHQHTGASCPCGHHGGPGKYIPVFPQKSGNNSLSCSACGTAGCGGACMAGCAVTEFAPIPQMVDPQEYIYDGGDRDPQVRLRSNNTQVGLDPEDTVIQYQTMDGKTNVDSGCRVAIYAPRFASVRKRQASSERDLALRAQAAVLPNGPNAIREQLPPINVTQPLKSLNKDNVHVVEAFRDQKRPMPTERVLPMITVSDAFKPYEDLAIIRKGDLLGTDPAKLAKSAAAARAWTNIDELNVFVDGQEAIESKDLKRAGEVSVYEFKGARIRLCKVASEQIANPGDTISFTIRFDNVGEQPLSKIVVTDSLAPRLEYIENSQDSSVATKFSTTPNEAGSVVLRWELENPIKPGEGGLVRFSCTVR